MVTDCLVGTECSVEDCQKLIRARGYCSKHYNWLRKYGSVNDPRPSMDVKFWKRAAMGDPDDCWLWQGTKNHRGYGMFNYRDLHSVAHRIAYRIAFGPIPEGLEIDHLCFTRACVNPFHLEAVSQLVNIQRGAAGPNGARQRIKACPQGHPYDDANSVFDKRGKRHCRECNRLSCRRRYYERKARTNG